MRKWLATSFFTVALGYSSAASAEACNSVLALSRERYLLVDSAESVRQAATSFCSEYKSGNSKSRSSRFGLSYESLKASFSSGRASEAQVGSKYCSAFSEGAAADNYYEQYIDNIAPGAFSAYQRCIEVKQQNIEFLIDTDSVLPEHFAMSITNRRPGAANVTFRATPSPGITCRWDNSASLSVDTISPQTVTIDCGRADRKQRGFVRISATNGAGSFTVPWTSYTTEGIPTQTMENLRGDISHLNDKLTKIEMFNDDIGRKIRDLGNIRDGSKQTIDWQGGKTCSPGHFVSGLTDVSAHGPRNSAPRALRSFEMLCTRITE